MLHDRGRDVENVRLLEGILAEHPGDLLAAKDDHRHAVHLRGHDAGDGISSAGAGGDENDGRLAGGAGVTVSHVHGTLFVADEDELHVRLHGLEGVKDRDGRAAGVTEDVFDAEVGEGFDEGLCAVHFGCAHELWGENCCFGGEGGVKSQNGKPKFASFWSKQAILNHLSAKNSLFEPNRGDSGAEAGRKRVKSPAFRG